MPRRTKEEKAAERAALSTDFYSELAKRVPDEAREHVTKLAEIAKDNTDISDYTAEHMLRQQDYAKVTHELKQQTARLEEDKERLQKKYDENVAWETQHKADYERMQKQLDHHRRLASADNGLDDLDSSPGVKPPNGDPPAGYMSQEEVRKLLEERDRGAIAYESRVADLRHRHSTTFKEFLDVPSLVEHATKKGLSLNDAYQEVYGDRLKERTDAELEERIARERKEASDETRAEILSNPSPLPYQLNSHEPTTLDYLTGRAEKPETGASAAVDEYWKMRQAEQQNSGS